MKTPALILTLSLAAVGVSSASAQNFRPAVANGAVFGAVAGAIVGGHNHDRWGEGAIIGAAAGALLGAAVEPQRSVVYERPAVTYVQQAPSVACAPTVQYAPTIVSQPSCQAPVQTVVVQAPPQVVYYSQPAPVVYYERAPVVYYDYAPRVVVRVGGGSGYSGGRDGGSRDHGRDGHRGGRH